MKKCTDEVKNKILARVVGFVQQHEASGKPATELQSKMNVFVLELNAQYGQGCVREVLKALNDKVTGPLN